MNIMPTAARAHTKDNHKCYLPSLSVFTANKSGKREDPNRHQPFKVRKREREDRTKDAKRDTTHITTVGGGEEENK
jgi:hypothetical protein